MYIGSWLLFCIASHTIIALCDSNDCRSFTLLESLAKSNGNLLLSPLRARKSDNYHYRNSWKSNNFRERDPSKKKQRTDKKDAKRIYSDNFTSSNKVKFNIAIAILEKFMLIKISNLRLFDNIWDIPFCSLIFLFSTFLLNPLLIS